MPDLLIKAELIKRINQGDAKAFETVYNLSYVYLCAVATKYVYSPTVAQELVNDVFLNIWHLRETLTFPLHTYLCRAVQNRCLNHIRSLRLREVPLSDVEEHWLRFREEQLQSDEHPLARLENKELREKIARTVDLLPPQCRTIFIQKFYYNKTSEEIAGELRLNASTVRVQLKIALAKLKKMLGETYPVFLLFI